MIVVVDGESGALGMDEAENLKALSVQLRGCDAEQAAVLLGDVGRLEGDHAWLDIDALRALSPLADDPDWSTGFDGVMTYAAGQGWVDGSRVRAHIC